MPEAFACVVGFVLATVFFYLSLLYEDEEGRLTNRFAEWWVRLDDVGRQAISRHLRFLEAVASSMSKALDRVFGIRLLSMRALAASICLSLASVWLTFIVVVLIYSSLASAYGEYLQTPTAKIILNELTPEERNIIYENAATNFSEPLDTFLTFGPPRVLIYVAAALAPLLDVRLRFMTLGVAFWSVAALTLAHMGTVLPWWTLQPVPVSLKYDAEFNSDLIAAAALGALFDLAAIAVCRWILRVSTSEFRRGRSAFLIVAATAIVAFLNLLVPFVVGLALFFFLSRTWGEYFIISAFSNATASALLLSYWFMAAALILHRLIWPSIERPLYALQRHRVLQYRKILFTIGLLSLGMCPSVGLRIVDLLKAIGVL